MALHLLTFIFGILGNIISFMVYLAPAPTFWRVYKKKSTEGFESLPYVCAVFSSMLWIYYALLKTNSFLLITINAAGCVIETFYISVFLAYAPKQAKMGTVRILVLLNLVGFSAILVGCNYLAKASIRVALLGWLCVAFSVVVFAAPLTIIRSVIRTKSVEFMPFPLSLSLTISAVMWFMYGLLQKDLYIVLPNVLGFAFGVAQMIMYAIYRKHGKMVVDLEKKLPESTCEISPPVKQAVDKDIAGAVALAVAIEVPEDENNMEEAMNDCGPPVNISRGTHEIETGCSTSSPTIGSAPLQLMRCVG